MNHSGETHSLQEAYQDHLVRRQGLALIKEMIKLIIDIQKHRGCTLAILSGDHFFETQLYSIQRDITEQLERIERIRIEFFTLEESKHVLQEWVCLRRQWTQDSPEENFLLHSNLISEIIKLIWHVVKRSNQLGLSEAQDQLIRFCFNDWLKMIETTAQARGLATHCAAREHNPGEIRSRLNFLHRQLKELDEQFQSALDEFAEEQAEAIQLKSQRVAYRDHLERFLSALYRDFCNRALPKMDADTIYTLGSHAVSACQQVLFSMLKRIDRAISPDLKSWIEHGEWPKSEVLAASSVTSIKAGSTTQIPPTKDDQDATNAYPSRLENAYIAK